MSSSSRRKKAPRNDSRSFATDSALPTNPSNIFRRFPVRSSNVLNYYKDDFSDLTDLEVIASILDCERTPCDRLGTSLVRVKYTRVPRGIFKGGHSGVVYTPKAENCNDEGIVSRGQGSDDNAYKNHPNLQRILPRCYSVLLIFDSSDKCIARHIVHGLYKFGGQARDEDSHIGSDGLYQQAPLSEATRIVVSEKVNGKAFVLTMFEHQGHVYFFGGSKGQHHVIREEYVDEDLEHLNPELFAYQEMKTFFGVWEGMNRTSRRAFQEEMIGSTQNDGCTACAEWADGKHMVALPRGAKPSVVMFGLVQNRGAITKHASLCDDIVTVLDWYTALGFEAAKYEILTPEDLDERREHLRSGTKAEGWVIYYQMKKQAEWNCIAVEKYKLWWYIIIRVIREFIKRPHNLVKYEHKLVQRLIKRNNDFMFVPDSIFNKWQDLALDFVSWFLEKGYDNRVDKLLGFDQYSVGMAGVWKEFIEETGSKDDFRLPGYKKQKKRKLQIETSSYKKSTSPREETSFKKTPSQNANKKRLAEATPSGVTITFSAPPKPPSTKSHAPSLGLVRRTSINKSGSIQIAINTGDGESKSSSSSRRKGDGDVEMKKESGGPRPRGTFDCGLLVIFQGICGLGKTYLRTFLETELEKHGVSAVGLEQDTFVQTHGLRQSGRMCLQQFRTLVNDGQYQVVFLQRNNANLEQFNKYARAAADAGWLVHVIAPKYMTTSSHLPLVCLQSIYQRFEKKDHPSFKDLHLGKQFQITLSFLAVFAIPSTRGTIDYVDEVDYLSASCFHNRIPNDTQEYFQEYLDHVKAKPFQAEEFDGTETVQNLLLDEKSYQSWRLSPETIAKNIVEKLMSTSLPAVKAYEKSRKTSPSSSKKKSSSKTKSSSSSFSGFRSLSSFSSSSRPKKKFRTLFGTALEKTSLDRRSPKKKKKTRTHGDDDEAEKKTKTVTTSSWMRSSSGSRRSNKDDSDVIFIYLGIDERTKRILREKIEDFRDIENVRSLPIEKLHHVTLMHKNDRDEDEDLWNDLLEREGDTFGVVVSGIGFSPRKLIAFSCELRSRPGGPTAGENMRQMCFSGVPHVTALLAKGVKPVDSLHFFKKRRNGDRTEGKYKSYKKDQICFSAQVRIFRAKPRW